MSTFRIIVTRCCYIRGQAVTPGAELDLLPAEVQPLLDCLRAELADPDDAPALRQALRAEFEAQAVAVPFFGQSPEAAQQQARDFEAAMKPKPRMGFLP